MIIHYSSTVEKREKIGAKNFLLKISLYLLMNVGILEVRILPLLLIVSYRGAERHCFWFFAREKFRVKFIPRRIVRENSLVEFFLIGHRRVAIDDPSSGM